MAINKELLERYKAMKAAKTEQQSSPQHKTGFAALSQTQTVTEKSDIKSQPEQQWNTTYSQNSQQSMPQNEIINNYNSQFTTSQSFMTTAPMPETADIFSQPTEVPITHQQENCPPVSEQKIKKFALIGYPLGHSMSEYIHLAGFKSVGINATYEIIPTPPEELSDRIKYLRSNGYSGFNVTIPLKLPVSLFLDEIDPSAGIVNAINTVVIDPNTNALRGYNTDVKGFISAIPSDFPLYNKTVAILGTGGAARAAITALAQKQVKEFRIYTRNIANSLELIDYLRKTFSNITFNSYQIDKFKDFSDVNLLVNATPIGMSGSTVGYSPAEEDELRTLPNDALIYDVVYNPKKTNLIRLAQKLNLKCINGVDMLVWQAYEAQKIWTGRTPDFKDMKIALLENL
ncbi:shikimate dehydrogenase [bacterium]|nr:shikimate dehydrogenase [bacterium]